MRARTSTPSGHVRSASRSWTETAASAAASTVGKAQNAPSPSASTSAPPLSTAASRTSDRNAASASAPPVRKPAAELRRPLDVDEEEGHRAGRKLRGRRHSREEALADQDGEVVEHELRELAGRAEVPVGRKP